MVQAQKLIDEINRCEIAISKSNSLKLKRDYLKHIKKLEKELKFYCNSRRIKLNYEFTK